MADSELSIVKFSFMNFWSTVITSRSFYPIQSLLIKLISALCEAEDEPDQKHKDRIKYLYEHTHSKVDLPISIVELAVFKNLDKGLNREISIGDKEFNLTQLYIYLDEVTLELTKISIEVAKKYSLEIPMGSFTSMQKGHQTTIGLE